MYIFSRQELRMSRILIKLFNIYENFKCRFQSLQNFDHRNEMYPSSDCVCNMVNVLIIGDSHLKRLQPSKLNFAADIDARGGRKAHQLTESYFEQKDKRKYQCFFILQGVDDIHHHEYHNSNPKTPQETANHLISCQLSFEPINIISMNFYEKTM